MKCPMLILPKDCTTLESEYNEMAVIFMRLNISCLGKDGIYKDLYSGLCNIKLIDNFDINTEIYPDDLDISFDLSNDDNSTVTKDVWVNSPCEDGVCNNHRQDEQDISGTTIEGDENETPQDGFNCQYYYYSPKQDVGSKSALLPDCTESGIVYGENEDSCSLVSNGKKYQCNECHQIFDQISSLNQHMVAIHSAKYKCIHCKKTFKNKSKFMTHNEGHGDPDIECEMCEKVFVSKFSLRKHRMLHDRKYQCTRCQRSFDDDDDLKGHIERRHNAVACERCDFVGSTWKDYENHLQTHKTHYTVLNIDDNYNYSDIVSNGVKPNDGCNLEPSAGGSCVDITEFVDGCDTVEEDCIINTPINDEYVDLPDPVVNKVLSHEFFLLRAKSSRKYKKVCKVCSKSFDRISDLKRHLIEHLIRSTLSKNPVSQDGTLKLQCVICPRETFTEIDKYKVHLREHAKLTIYKCKCCDKSFSDSSNFSKHKKVHGLHCFQCRKCQKKFNSEKMMNRHMERHRQTQPLKCSYCEYSCHFQTDLNKHLKSKHSNRTAKFRCKFCLQYFMSLKDKWEHEWKIHKVRKSIVDCTICCDKFRKYSELKRHCDEVHDVKLMSAKKLLRSKSNYIGRE